MVGDILQPTHLLLILVVALLVLGPKRLPEVGRTLGTGLRDFKAAINGESTSHDEPEPHGYVETETETETEPDSVPAFAPDPSGDEATGGHVSDAGEAYDPVADEPVLEPELSVPVGSDPTAASDVSVAQDAAPAAAEPRPASTAGFASALAASRQRADGDDPTDDE